MTEDEMVGWHHQLNGHEFEQALGVVDGQGSLVCCGPWGHKESNMTEGLNRTKRERKDSFSVELGHSSSALRHQHFWFSGLQTPTRVHTLATPPPPPCSQAQV